MENMTVTQLWAYLLGAIAIYKTVEYLWDKFINPKLKKDAKFESMEKALVEIKEKLDKDFKMLDNHEKRLEHVEEKIKEDESDREDIHNALHVIVVGQQAITKSLLEGGNNRDGLQKAEEQLEEYLRSKI